MDEQSRPGSGNRDSLVRPDIPMVTFDDLLDYATKSYKPEELERFFRNDPADHAPVWHEFGLYGHLWCVCQAAERLRIDSGRGITSLATLHDIGKIHQFPKSFAFADKGLDPYRVYIAHEEISARIAENRFSMPIRQCRVIASHQHAYDQTKPETIIGKLPDREQILDWIMLCACDHIGKGTTTQQVASRDGIVKKLRDVAKLTRISASNKVLAASLDAIHHLRIVPGKNGH
jgi:hypothetical protein